MSNSNRQTTDNNSVSDNETKDWKSKGNRALIINIIFFLILFASIFLINLSGFAITVAVIMIAFIASILYIYLS